MTGPDTTLAEVMDAHRVPSEMDAALARIRERMFASHLVTGRAVGRYVLIEPIGEGGMGAVMRAYDPRLQREVALKRLRSAGNADLRGRLLREARAMAKLRHPNVVSVYDVELIDDELVIAMEYVRGIDLRRWLGESRAPEEILKVLAQAGRGLGAAHAAGLVHRDFKPANVLLDEAGRAQVTDFGLVRDATQGTDATLSDCSSTDSKLDELRVDRTSADIALGTPRYMAPEQESGGEVDPRADVYAFCVSLWEALAHEAPFSGDSLSDLRLAKLTTKPRWPKAVSVRPEVLRALERGLLPRASDRWPTVAALLSALEPQAKSKRLLWLGLPITAALAVPAVMASTATTEPLCESEAGPSWSAERPVVAERLAQLDGAFAEDVSSRALTTVDGFVRQWHARRTAACDAETRDPKTRDLELACLRVGRARLEAVLNVLRTLEAAEVPNAHRLLSGLPDLESCSDQGSALAQHAQDSSELRRVKSRLAASYDLYALARYADALQEVTAAMGMAEAAELDELWLEARMLVGTIYVQQRRFEEAVTSLRESLSLAVQRGNDRLIARGASLLGGVLATRGSSTAEGVTLTQIALDMSPRTQDTASWNTAIRTNASIALSSAGRPDKAAELGLEAIRVSREGGRGRTPQHAETLDFAAGSLCQAGRYGEGLTAVNDALVLARELLGDHHPQLGGPLGTRGLCRFLAGETDAGIADYKQVVSLYEAAYGPENERVGVMLDNLGLALAENGDPFEAEELLLRSLAIKTRLYDEGHLQLSYPQVGLASALRHQGRFGEAEALLHKALQSRIANLGRDNVLVLQTNIELALLAMDQGRLGQAGASLDEANRIADIAVEPDSDVRARIDGIREQLESRSPAAP